MIVRNFALASAALLLPAVLAHEGLADDPSWLYIARDLNPRAMGKTVKGFVSAQSRFLDLTVVSMH
jgi:peptide/nickel transport system substrate-binding protein